MIAVQKYPAFPTTKNLLNGLLDDVFNRNISAFIGTDGLVSTPAVNVVEDKNGFRLEVAAPGYAKDNFSINVEGDLLTVSAQKETKTEETDERFTRREFNYAAFKRSFTLPKTVNQTEVSAVYENGILSVSIPKKEEAKPVQRVVEVK